ncbi:MAG: hypothetical protein HYU30_06395 [Chloroflexi bacterium]|jgi:hypothetical protein|nr:hypothetical protein [Chloroflexota bacterium]
MVNRPNLPAERYRVKLFSGASLESDINTWLVTNAGALVQLFMAYNGSSAVVLALYRTSQ